jgi:predicted MPP superfamily phosphohydrolase
MFLIYLLIFIASGLAILLGSHYLVYLSVVYFFSINSPVHKEVLLGVLVFLSVSFILATLLTSLKENFFTRAFYSLSGFWIGLFLNILMATLATWIIIDAAQIFHLDVDAAILSLFLFGLALAYSIYGVWNALHPQLKNITVTIPDLPAQWRGKKIIQLSDIHIGHVNRSEFVDDVIKKVNSVSPEMVVVTGDMFDGMDGDLDSPIKLVNNINSPKGVFFVTGNHETYLGMEQVSKDLEKTKAIFVRDQVLDIDGLKLIGINYPDRMEKKDMITVLNSLKNDFYGQPNIFLYHSPVDIAQVKEAGVNLELCGHTHDGQLFPLNYITKLMYKGYDYGLHQMGNYTLYTTSGTGSWGPPMRTGSNPEIVVITLQ